MTANFDRFNASFDRARNVLLSALGHHFEAKKQEALHRQQLADNYTETTEGVAETLADSRGSDDVVCDTLSSARDSRKRKNSNDGSDGSDDDERRDGGSAAEKRARSIPTTSASATTSNANESSESNGREEGHAIVLHNIGNGVESSSNNKENNATLRRGGIGEKGEIKKHYHLAICFQQTILFSSNLFSTNLTQTFVLFILFSILAHQHQTIILLLLQQQYNNHERMNHNLPLHHYNNHHYKMIIEGRITIIIIITMDNNLRRVVTEPVNLHKEEHLHRHLHRHLQAVQLLQLLKLISNVS